MLSKRILMAACAAAFIAGAAAPAFADPHHRYDRHDHYDRYDRYDRGYSNRDWYFHPRWRKVYVAPPAESYYPYYETPVYAGPVSGSRIVCNDSYNPVPAVIGGVAGGAIGSTIGKGSGRTASIITGALLGTIVGGQYSSVDRHCTEQVFTSQVGVPVTWQNPRGNAYEVTPVRDYRTDGRYCREYQSVATVGGRRSETYGTACMQPDGSWEVVN